MPTRSCVRGGETLRPQIDLAEAAEHARPNGAVGFDTQTASIQRYGSTEFGAMIHAESLTAQRRSPSQASSRLRRRSLEHGNETHGRSLRHRASGDPGRRTCTPLLVCTPYSIHRRSRILAVSLASVSSSLLSSPSSPQAHQSVSHPPPAQTSDPRRERVIRPQRGKSARLSRLTPTHLPVISLRRLPILASSPPSLF